MKFICDNCKARYQIGDEKVAGRMVRMQCRRCGHLIQVSASVTESSVARALPVEPPREAGDDAHVAPPSDEAPAADGGAVSPLKPPLASSLGPRRRACAAPAGIAGPAAPGGRSSTSGRAALPSPDRRRAPRPATTPQASRHPGLSSRRPRRRLTCPAGARGAPARSPAPAARAAEPTPPAGAAGAFTRAMSNDRPLGKAPAVRATASEDWYVGVGGVPLGPVRLSVIRDKALAGAVDGESLVWREGFDEWQPLKNFPELLEIVTQAQSTRLSPPARRISTTGSSVGQPQASSAKAPSSSRVPALGGAAPARTATREPEPPGLNEQAPAVARLHRGGDARGVGFAVRAGRMLRYVRCAVASPRLRQQRARRPHGQGRRADPRRGRCADGGARRSLRGRSDGPRRVRASDPSWPRPPRPSSLVGPAAWPRAVALCGAAHGWPGRWGSALCDDASRRKADRGGLARRAGRGPSAAEPAPFGGHARQPGGDGRAGRRSGMSPLAYAFIASGARRSVASPLSSCSPRSRSPCRL